MRAAVVMLLVGLWVAVLMPGLFHARRHASPASSISRFHKNMDLLERTRRGGAQRSVHESAGFAAHDARRGPEVGPGGAWASRLVSVRPPSWFVASGSGGPAARAAQRPRIRPPAPSAARAAVRPARKPARKPARQASTPHAAMMARRRRVLVGLAASTMFSAVLAPLVGLVGWVLLVIALAATAGYVTLLRRLELQRRLQQRVLTLADDDEPAFHGAPPRRTAAGGR